MRILVTGSTGFVGKAFTEAAIAAGHEVLGMVRTPRTSDTAGLSYVTGDVRYASTIDPAALAGCEAVVHLVGIIREVPSRGQTFQSVHVEGTRHLLQAAASAGIEGRFIYVSAIGSEPDAPAEYSRTKAQAEKEVAESGLPFTIIRPSVILGKKCEFLEQMENLIRRPPLAPFSPPFVPVPGDGSNRFQPVYIDDLNTCILRCLEREETAGRTYEIGGGSVVTFDQLLETIGRHIGVKKSHLHIPMPLMRAAAAVLETILPDPPITTDQLANLQRDNICDNTPVERELGIAPLPLQQALARVYATGSG